MAVLTSLSELSDRIRLVSSMVNAALAEVTTASSQVALMQSGKRWDAADRRAAAKAILAGLTEAGASSGATLREIIISEVTLLTDLLGLEMSPRWDTGVSSVSIDVTDGGTPEKAVITAVCAGSETPFDGFAAGDTIILSGCTESEYNGVEYVIDSVAGDKQSITLTDALTTVGLDQVDLDGEVSIVITQTETS